jgi:hypothetical protein
VDDGVREVVEMLSSGIIENPYENTYYNTEPKLRGAGEDRT